MTNTGEPMQLLMAIVSRGTGRAWSKKMKQMNIGYNIQLSGHGTASSDMLDILGLDSTAKDIVVSLGAVSAVSALADEMGETLRKPAGNGLLMILSVSAVSRLVAAMATYNLENSERKGNSAMKKSEYDYSLILVVANRGYSAQVMQAARQGGATGGTLIRARMADAGQAQQFYGITAQEEKEVTAILAPGHARDGILESVNRECGLKTPAQAVICALPVDQAFKL